MSWPNLWPDTWPGRDLGWAKPPEPLFYTSAPVSVITFDFVCDCGCKIHAQVVSGSPETIGCPKCLKLYDLRQVEKGQK